MNLIVRSVIPFLLAAALPPAGTAQAQVASSATSPAAAAGTRAAPILLDTITIIGSKENLERLPGSGIFVAADEIRTFAYDDINQVVRHTPGVYFRQEDGYGLFPNVSLRGVSTTRNSKITIMEDGILMAPAPYSDPAAYYSPNVGRMSGLEVLKGSSQIRYGPETTGGVINHLSTPVPARNAGYLATNYGSDRDFRVHAHYGGRFELPGVTVGFLVENAYRRTDGFKFVEPALGGGFAGSDQTGFVRNEPMVKLVLDFKAARPQSLAFSYGRSDIQADETYLGQTDPDFRARPHRRYAASRFDEINTDQERTALRYALRPIDSLALNLTAYRTEFARNWYKLDVAGVGTGGFLNLGEALAGQYGPDIVTVLRGGAAGRLRVRANNRSYGAEGLSALSVLDFGAGNSLHRLEVGARWHRDHAARFQWDDVYTQASDGSATRTTAGIPGTQENRRAESDAFALHLEDQITLGRLMISPGLRYERIDYTDIRRSTAAATLSQVTSRRGKSIDYYAPGVGATWQQSEQLTWLAGLYRGVSPPGPGSVGNLLEEETSVGFEAGFRHNNRRDLSLELIGFHTAFDNLIVEQNAGGGGGTGQTSNIGQVDTSGIELALAYDPSLRRGWAVRNPWNLSLTWTRARLGNDVNATGNSGGVVESIFSGGRKGNRLPYIPEFQVALGTRFESGAWSLHLDTFYQPRAYASANNSSALINPDANAAAGLQPAADSRYGRVDAFFLLDASLHYRLGSRTRLKVSGTNLLNWEYIASRVPIGPRPGAPRTFTGGIEYRF